MGYTVNQAMMKKKAEFVISITGLEIEFEHQKYIPDGGWRVNIGTYRSPRGTANNMYDYMDAFLGGWTAGKEKREK